MYIILYIYFKSQICLKFCSINYILLLSRSLFMGVTKLNLCKMFRFYLKTKSI